MSTRKKQEPQPGGRGQTVVPDEETQRLMIRVGESHFEMLDDLVRWGFARDRSAATRKAIELAHSRAEKLRSR